MHIRQIRKLEAVLKKLIIPGLRIICNEERGYYGPDAPDYPFQLDVLLRLPEHLQRINPRGSSKQLKLQARGKTLEALEEFIRERQLRSHPRLISLRITKPKKCVRA